ncbi:hypothetical protein FDG2_1952 [Candidatus Protofrankia californiensis]|uniref:Uncharacterized protein n=1 Tax=Candidatus Protofrankia californiensis TaxID=1839754 RepID=A0A1C3NWP9_9ACTN|nr:hypothetical protein FDG2_1952 [Candidatus Protofrankia californiensis]
MVFRALGGPEEPSGPKSARPWFFARSAAPRNPVGRRPREHDCFVRGVRKLIREVREPIREVRGA